MPIAFEVLASHLLANAWERVAVWFPNGRRQGREWCVGSLEGEKGQSLKINCDSGKWQDFATGDKGGDLIALYAAIHHLSQSDAAHQLSGDSGDAPRVNGHNPAPSFPAPEIEEGDGPLAHQDPARERPPEDIALQPRAFRHAKHGVPAVVYEYRDDEGALLFVVARYEGSEGKSFCPFTWGKKRNGDMGWIMRAPPKPRPLYGLDRLARLERRVVVVEGEKAADALQSVITRSPVVTWPGGAQNWRYADWRPLAGRAVLLWPDADPPGVEAMRALGAQLMRLGCRVGVVRTEGLPDAYDAADLIATGCHGRELMEWISARTHEIERADLAPREPQRVSAPESVEGVTVPAPHEGDGQSRSAVQLLQAAQVLFGPRGPHPNVSNVTRIVAQLAKEGRIPEIWFDSFLGRVCCDDGREWQDRDTLDLLARMQHELSLEKVSRETVDQAVALHAWNTRRNCAQEWLQSLEWDGHQRLEHLASDGFGAPRTAYTMAVGRCYMVGMVARILMPGCQMDNILVLEGPQGITKTQALRALGGPWFTETTEPVTNKDFYLTLTGKMLVEVSEFSSFNKADAESIKAAITRTVDRYRLPYDKRPGDHPRQCVFAATTNNKRWNKDPTGARRFWPLKCGAIDVEWIMGSRELLFAEANACLMKVPIGTRAEERLKAGAAWWDVPEEEAREAQRQRYKQDSLAAPMRRFVLAQKLPFLTYDVIRFGLGLEGAAALDERIADRVSRQLTHWGFDSELMNGDIHWLPRLLPTPSDEEKPPEE